MGSVVIACWDELPEEVDVKRMMMGELRGCGWGWGWGWKCGRVTTGVLWRALLRRRVAVRKEPRGRSAAGGTHLAGYLPFAITRLNCVCGAWCELCAAFGGVPGQGGGLSCVVMFPALPSQPYHLSLPCNEHSLLTSPALTSSCLVPLACAGAATRLESQFRLTYSMILNLLRVEDLKVGVGCVVLCVCVSVCVCLFVCVIRVRLVDNVSCGRQRGVGCMVCV